MNLPDAQLLTRYLDHNDEGAFSQLVAIYSGMVLNVARRTTGNQEAAQEAAQNTFIKLAQKAPSLRGRESLGGWLHKTAMFSARSITRTRRREERKRDEFSNSLTNNSSSPDTIWKDLEPILDDSLMSLSEKDRNALVMRFYRGYSVQEVAAEAKVTLAAAQKRLGRALERLRSHLTKKGVSLSVPALSTGLGLWMSDASCQAALVTSWSATATATASQTISTPLPTILATMTKTKLFTGIAIVALLSGGTALIIKGTNQPSPAAAGSSTPNGNDSKISKRTPSSRKLRLQELEQEFGADRVKQARLIASYYLSSHGKVYDSAFHMMDEGERKWLEAQSTKWGLDPAQTQQLQQLTSAKKNELSQELNRLLQSRTEAQTTNHIEAILLADKVKRGELSLNEFEELHRDLSLGNRDYYKSLKRNFWVGGSAHRFVDISLMNSAEFLASVTEIIPAEKRSTFLEENSKESRQLALSFLEVNHHIPHLSEKQSAQLEDFVRSTGIVMFERDDLKEILTEEQNSAWIADMERFRQALGRTSVVIRGPGGKKTEFTVKRKRVSTNGNLPAYFWEDLLTLDEAEAEARIHAKSRE